MDLATGAVVMHDGEVRELTRRQHQLLAYLVRHGDRAVSREELLERVWGFSPSVNSRTTDTTTRRLREKIERDPGNPDHVLTVFGEGYRFVRVESDRAQQATNLGRERDPFVGRSTELHRWVQRMSQPGWWTLVGPPGVGKTRLAREIGQQLVGTLSGGVWFCDVAPASDLAGVIRAVSEPLGIGAGDRSSEDGLARLARAIASRGPTLLLLDNCEQVVEQASQVASGLAEDAPEVRVLATSRHVLAGTGERTVAIEPPELDDAVQMFASLARRVRPEFTLDASNRASVAELVERLDRLPLAMALAAGRLSAMSVSDLLDRLQHRFRLLRGRGRAGDSRQRTLRATMDWSWDMLTEGQQRALAACSIFRGGFTEAAARDVLAIDAVGPVLAELCGRSLLVHDGDRYDGYAFVREYAGERSEAAPELHREVEERHAAYFASWVEQTEVSGHAAELANLWDATHRCLARGDGQRAWTIGRAALDVGELTSSLFEVATLAESLLAAPGLPLEVELQLALRATWTYLSAGRAEPCLRLLALADAAVERSGDPHHRVRLLRTRSGYLRRVGLVPEAAEALREALQIARACDDTPLLADALLSFGLLERELGHGASARASYTEVLALLDPDVHETRCAHAMGNLAMLERLDGRHDSARELYQAALLRHRVAGRRRDLTTMLMGLGNVELDRGEFATARGFYDEALQIALALGEQSQVGSLLGNIGLLARFRGDLDEAVQLTQRSLTVFRKMDDPHRSAMAVGNLGELHLQAGDFERADKCLGLACSGVGDSGDADARAELMVSWARCALERDEVPAARQRIQISLDKALDVGNPLLLASALACRGLVELAEGQVAAAEASLLKAARCVPDVGPTAPVRDDLDRLERALAVARR